MINHEFFMRAALEEAKKAFERGEVPIGAVLVRDGVILARAHNQTEMAADATAHAEIACIREASKFIGNWRLSETVLYTTVEPCSMCMGAIFLARIGTLVYGAKDIRHGACGSWVDLLDRKHPTHAIELIEGVLADESGLLLKSFFKTRREEKNGRGRKAASGNDRDAEEQALSAR